MSHTNINVDAIEAALPAAAAYVRANIIEEAIKTVNIWLTPDPKILEVIEIITYKDFHVEHRFSLDANEQRQLIEKMFDDNMSLVFIQKTKQTTTPGGWLSPPMPTLSTTETRNYLFTKLALDINKEIKHIKETLNALRNPRVSLTLEEHKNFVAWLKQYNINLSDYYI